MNNAGESSPAPAPKPEPPPQPAPATAPAPAPATAPAAAASTPSTELAAQQSPAQPVPGATPAPAPATAPAAAADTPSTELAAQQSPAQPVPGATPAPAPATAPAAAADTPPTELAAPQGPAQPEAAAAPERPRRHRLLRRGAMAAGALAALAVVFYVEENWRGRSDWEAAQTKLVSLQEKLDWAVYVPPAAPDDQNFYKAPRMQDWFGGKGTNELTARLSLDTFAELAWRRAHSNEAVVVTELIIRPPATGTALPEVEPPSPGVLPKLDNLPLPEAILRLARQANLKVQIDPQVPARSLVSGNWPNASPLAGLMKVLSEFNLRWVDDPKTGRPLIKEAGAIAPAGGVEPVNRDFVLGMIRNAIGPVGEIADGILLSSNALQPRPQAGFRVERGSLLSSNALPAYQPWHLSIAPDSVPTQKDLDRLFGPNVLGMTVRSNFLEVLLFHAPVAAADYLAWSDQFSADFDKIREAVKRPSARLDGDYEQLCRVPAPDLTAVGVVASRLSSRAKAFLLNGEPEEALRELTLLRNLGGCLEGKPAGRGMAMSRASAVQAITDLYVATIADGLRAQVWREGELAALQDQLSRIDAVSLVWNALESERAGDCRLLETGAHAELARAWEVGGGKTNIWEEIRSPSRLALQFMPRGWLWQNMAHLAVWEQKMIDSVDGPQGIIRPHQVEEADVQIQAERLLHRHSFYWFLARHRMPGTSARLKTTAQVQTAVNEAVVACALERCRLARGEYPATLNELAPQFIALLPVDPVNGGPLRYRLVAPGRFQLYSIGWDEKDDHGAPVDAAGKGDWVWGRL